MALDEGLVPALHLHHKGDESRAVSLVRSGLLSGIFDSSINGLGGCPFAEGSGANLSTQTLVRHLNAWGFDCGLQEEDLADAARIARALTNVLLS
jgi:hydroxymethylglutaryl-CoA lyase